jgi:hypothetical protein
MNLRQEADRRELDGRDMHYRLGNEKNRKNVAKKLQKRKYIRDPNVHMRIVLK